MKLPPEEVQSAMSKASETECWGTQALVHWMEEEKLAIESDEEEPELCEKLGGGVSQVMSSEADQDIMIHIPVIY